MVTYDKNFNLAFWKNMKPKKLIEKTAPIGKIMFANLTIEKKDGLQKWVNLGFIGDKMGIIEYFDERRLILE